MLSPEEAAGLIAEARDERRRLALREARRRHLAVLAPAAFLSFLAAAAASFSSAPRRRPRPGDRYRL